MAKQEQTLASVLDAYIQLNSLRAQGIEHLTSTVRHRGGIVTRLDFQYRAPQGIVDVTSLDNNAALMAARQDADKANCDVVHATKCSILTQALEDSFGTYSDMEQQYKTVKRHNLLQAANAPDRANFIENEELSTFEVTSVLDLYKLLKSSTITQYTVNNRRRLTSTVKIMENYIWNAWYRGYLELNLVKNSPMGQMVANLTGKHEVVDLLRGLARENDEVIAYDQQQARAQLGEGILDNAYHFLDQNFNQSQFMYYKAEAEGYRVQVDGANRELLLDKLVSNPAITDILQEYALHWAAENEFNSMWSCNLEVGLEKKYGSWRELKLRALLDTCEA